MRAAAARRKPTSQQLIEHWFRQRGWSLAPFQVEAMDAYLRGESGLIHSPTGSGKTLAAWLGPLAEALEDCQSRAGLRVLWITPLRALANDIQRNLEAVARGLGIDWEIGLRTGDTSSTLRKKQRTSPPHALVTTPESLSIMLSFADSHEALSSVDAVVVDEWHELMGTKRGVQLELCLSHLRALNPKLRVWGLSATLGNLPEALQVLLGTSGGRLITGPPAKEVRIHSVLPPTIERFPWAGHLGIRLLQPVIDAIERAESTLLFTNTRSQAELWYRAIAEARLDWIDRTAIHHGSIDMDLRRRIEAAVQTGELKCVVCTSSLDLGVDFAPVDQVIQIGSPKGVARLLQRAGRSGHRPGGLSSVICVPTHAFELIEFAAARRAQRLRRLESRQPLRRSLDVLVQHAMTLAAGPGFQPDAFRDEVSKTHAFEHVTDTEWQWLLDFLTRGGDALQGYPEYRRVEVIEGTYRVNDARIARMHRMQIGTITSDSEMSLKWMNGSRLGSVEEALIARLKPGDAFMFAGRVLQLVRVRDMTAYVKLATTKSGRVARWQGGRMPLSNELADTVQELLAAGATGDFSEPEMKSVRSMLELQQRWSLLPSPDTLLAESTRSREGFHLFIYPFAGRTVNEGIATLLAYRLAKEQPATFAITANDYGAELLTHSEIELDTSKLRTVLSKEGLAADLLASLNFSEVARRQFRDIARIAGLVFQGYPGARKYARQLQASSSLIFDVLRQYDPKNLLLDQARREVFELQLQETRLAQSLAALERKELALVKTESLTPLSFPIWAERLRSQILSTESFQERLQRMIERLNAKAARD